MEPDVRYTFIGATLVALVAAAIIALLWISQAGAREAYRKYQIVFVRQSLEGLQVGGDVNMRGIKVGQVVGYSLSPTRVNRVTVTIRVERDTPISENTVAVVSRTLVTGIARIGLRTPMPPGRPLERAEGQDYPVIKEGTSTEEQITDALTRIAESGTEAIERVNALLDQPNRDALRDVLINLRDLSAGLNARLDRLDRTLATVNRAADSFGHASADVAASVDRIGHDVGPLARQAQTSIRDVSDSVKTLQTQIVALAQRLDAASQTASLDLHATARELRVTAEALDRTLNRYRDPRALIFGPNPAQLGPGETVK